MNFCTYHADDFYLYANYRSIIRKRTSIIKVLCISGIFIQKKVCCFAQTPLPLEDGRQKERQFYCVSNEGSLLLLAIHKLWSEALSSAKQQAIINGNVNFNWALGRLFSAITKWKVPSMKKELWTVLGTTQKSQWEWHNALCASDWLLFFSSLEFRNQTTTNQRHYWFLQSYAINTGFFGSIRGCTRKDERKRITE